MSNNNEESIIEIKEVDDKGPLKGNCNLNLITVGKLNTEVNSYVPF